MRDDTPVATAFETVDERRVGMGTDRGFPVANAVLALGPPTTNKVATLPTIAFYAVGFKDDVASR